MKQYAVINTIVDELIKRKLINVCYIKGSFARSEEDEYSNIDLFCNFLTGEEGEFNKIKYEIFEKYSPIIFFKSKKDVDYVVYIDGININLHHVYLNKEGIIDLKGDKVLIIYNPNNVLFNTNRNSELEYDDTEIGEIIDEISLNALEFYRNSMRNDYPLMIRIASDIYYSYSKVIHYYMDKSTSKLGAKNILKNMDIDARRHYIEIVKKFNFNTLKDFIMSIFIDLDNILISLPVSIASKFNYDFFKFVQEKIKNI